MRFFVHEQAFPDHPDRQFILVGLDTVQALLDDLVKVLLVELIDPDQAGVELKILDIVLLELFLDAHGLDFTDAVNLEPALRDNLDENVYIDLDLRV